MKKLLVLGIICLTGCDQVPSEQSPVVTNTGLGYGARIKTVRHDDHSFVVLVTDHGAGIIHHPSCPIEGSQRNEHVAE